MIHQSTTRLINTVTIVIVMLLITSITVSAQPSFPKSFPTYYKEGHRGGTGLMPENTIQSMKKGVEAGANVVELDVYTSKDGKVIVTHDPHINWKISLTADGKELTEEEAKKYPVHHMNYADIRKFDVGMKAHPSFPDQQKVKAYIPLLGELIDSVEQYVKRKKLPLPVYNIELKSSVAFDSVYNAKPEELVDAVMAVVKQTKIGDRFYIQSFDVRPLQYVHKKYPKVVVGFLVSNKNTFDENIQQLGFLPHLYSPAYKLVTPELVTQCKAKRCKIVPWTVNTLEEMKTLHQLGVDGMITDYPNYFSALN